VERYSKHPLAKPILEAHDAIISRYWMPITPRETSRAPALFSGDGVNDPPALVRSSSGSPLVIRARSRQRALSPFTPCAAVTFQSAVGGMALRIIGMFTAFGGLLPAVGGSVFQEFIDLAAVLNALRAAVPGGELSDYSPARDAIRTCALVVGRRSVRPSGIHPRVYLLEHLSYRQPGTSPPNGHRGARRDGFGPNTSSGI
jgi:hypothetical protein